MSDAPAMILALLAGALLGTFFFCGLWWTIRRGLSSKRPALLFAGSLMLRMIATLAGFYLVSRGDPRRLVACLLGFLVARLVAARLAPAPIAEGRRIAGGGEP